jgi:hypothetical protein
VSNNNTAYSYTVSVTQPNQGQIDSGSGQFGTQCGTWFISEGFSGQITMRVDITSPSASNASASVNVTAPAVHLSHVSVFLDSSFYFVGETATVCWDAGPAGVTYDYEAYLQTFLEETGTAVSGQQECRTFVVTEDMVQQGILVEIYAFENGQQFYGAASAEADHG